MEYAENEKKKNSDNKHEHLKTVKTKQEQTESNEKKKIELQIVLSIWRQLPTNKKSSRRIYVHLPLICECINDERHIQDKT